MKGFLIDFWDRLCGYKPGEPDIPEWLEGMTFSVANETEPKIKKTGNCSNCGASYTGIPKCQYCGSAFR